MKNFLRNLITEWRKLGLPFESEKIVVAISGGADSVSLLLALYELKKPGKLNHQFVAAHFNHKLRGAESDADEKFVENLAKNLNFEFVTAAPKEAFLGEKGNLEQRARTARYDFLAAIAEKESSEIILTAHTVNDQAETFLMNLLRGSGLRGLGAIPSKRFLDIKNQSIKIVRPLLSWAKRADTEEFCREMKTEFCVDKMNSDLKFTRVRIRRELIPMLESFNPKIVQKLANTADLLRQDLENDSFENAEIPEKLEVNHLLSIEKAKRGKLLRLWIEKRAGSLRGIESVHLKAMEELIESRKSGREVELPNKSKVIKSGGKLFFEKSKVEKSRSEN